MKALVIGFPKAGTTTLHRAFRMSGLRSAHWKIPEGYCGELIYRADRAGRDPLQLLKSYDCIAEAEVCLPGQKLNFWPNLDFPLLGRIRSFHPGCHFILNYRDPEKIAASMRKWADMAARLTRSDIPGLPAGAGGRDGELEQWIERHFIECRRHFAQDPHFLELDIESPDAPDILSTAMRMPIRWWGVTNAGARPKKDAAPARRADIARLGRIAGRFLRRMSHQAVIPLGLVRKSLRARRDA